MGGRLRYADAIALWESLSADPSTYCGMSAVHMVLPMDATAIITAIQAGGTSILGDLAPEKAGKKHVEVTDEERREAEASMSSLFGLKKSE
ncbi:hypothetical protein [uncultured Bifidobacterium sp.]|uniref:hypothetical protein n=1 Tax=uncultured Bifidobacterium sp. TaxID=165187 RepID=UPI00280C2CE6|nr:hypothetical protein [uncultured Bifidobacterium sp.]